MIADALEHSLILRHMWYPSCFSCMNEIDDKCNSLVIFIEKKTGWGLRQTEHIRLHLWNGYSLTVNQVVMMSVKCWREDKLDLLFWYLPCKQKLSINIENSSCGQLYQLAIGDIYWKSWMKHESYSNFIYLLVNICYVL